MRKSLQIRLSRDTTLNFGVGVFFGPWRVTVICIGWVLRVGLDY